MGRAQDVPWIHTEPTPAQRTARLLGAMTTAEKFEQIVGAPGVVPDFPQCYGTRHVPGIPRLRIPTLRVTNGPVGIGASDCKAQPATALPSGMAVAASFDTAVATQMGDVIGAEARALALQVVEGPGLNLARVPQGGRNFEYFGEDPFLTGTMGVAEIRAIQGHGVIAMAKHFVANDQESNRTTVNETIADRVLHELYLLPFEMAVKDGKVASVMCSYNAVNGPHECEDRHHLTDVLRGEWGFSGYVQSDFFAVHSTAPTLLAGMDHEMPGSRDGNPANGPWFTPERLQAALDAHAITIADIDTALARRYQQMFRLGIFDQRIVQAPIDATRDGSIARSIGEAAAVLLKNRDHLLPLDAKALHSVALIGKVEYATKAVAGCCNGSSDVLPLYTVTPIDGVKQVLASLGSTATATLAVVAKDNGNLADAVALARSADVVVVLAGTLSDEGRDRPDIDLGDGQDAMIAAVAAANPRTVVVLKDNASVLLPWIDQVPAVLETWFPGQEDGDIAARLLCGVVTPSGKLPVTFPRRGGDLPANTARQWPGVAPQGNAVSASRNDNGPAVEYSEGLQIGYRWYQARRITPQFPFGFGLSYTTFRLSQFAVTPRESDGAHPIIVQFVVENTGHRRGAEVPQLYLGLPDSAGEPRERLVAFDKVWLEPGTKRVIRLVIDPRASNHPLSWWDTKAQKWVVGDGQYRVSVGTSSADIVFADTVRVTAGSRMP
jgi:beta-glucosidase